MENEILQALVGLLEVKDQATAAHTWRVVLYTRALAEAAGADNALVKRLTFAAALHDVGKIDIPSRILQKPGPLTDAEFDIMKRHTTLGHKRLLELDESDPVVLELVRHHHERVDGKGYPDGIGGSELPIGARYFSVIDSFDAMTSIRPYRHAVGKDAAENAIAELKKGIGTRYDPTSVEVFADLYHTGQLDWILEFYNDACPVPAYAPDATLEKPASTN